MKAVYAVLQSKTARKVLQDLLDNQHGLMNGDLSKRIHLPRSTISKCIACLSSVHLVRRSFTTDGRILYEVLDREKVLRLLAVFQKNTLNVVADRFINLWNL